MSESEMPNTREPRASEPAQSSSHPRQPQLGRPRGCQRRLGFQKESQQRSVTAGAECALAIRAA